MPALINHAARRAATCLGFCLREERCLVTLAALFVGDTEERDHLRDRAAVAPKALLSPMLFQAPVRAGIDRTASAAASTFDRHSHSEFSSANRVMAIDRTAT